MIKRLNYSATESLSCNLYLLQILRKDVFQMSKNVIFKKICIAVIMIALGWNALWLANLKSYDRFVGASATASSLGHNGYSLESDEIASYYVKKPGYLSFSGNLAVSSIDDSISIILWPSFLCRTIDDYGIILKDEFKENAYLIYVDEHMNINYNKSTGMDYAQKKIAEEIFASKKEAVLALYYALRDKLSIE